MKYLMHGVLIAAGLLLGCAASPERSATTAASRPDRAMLQGTFKLIPVEHAKSGTGGGGSYGDRRMRDTTFVDYSRPGFALVYLTSGPRSSAPTELVIRSTRFATRLEPANAAVGLGAPIHVVNRSRQPQVVSWGRT